MKRLIILLVTFLLSISVFAQNTAPISFLGIPIDGTKANMVKAIERKGFEHIKTNDGEDFLIGEFNGRESYILIGTNRNKVYRIIVAYKNDVSEAQIKIDYNNLLYQFKESEKYVEWEENLPIPDDENISYEITVNKKTYDAAFWAKPISLDSRKNGQVWFRIHKYDYDYDKYYITICYDNLLNQANGEDL